jgi:hypothetical protein
MGGWTTGQASTGRSTDLSPLTGCGLSPPHVTLDPDIPHRGIRNPLGVTAKLVAEYGLAGNTVLVCGYAPGQLYAFAKLGMAFDLVLLDGSHTKSQVESEILVCDPLLRPGGLLVLDDINFWLGPRTVYENFPVPGYESVPLDSRVGVLKKGKSEPESPGEVK